jgi:2,3,4,5-tetrahydropyridine-2,6-dicarboxylate N-succinyltransferase
VFKAERVAITGAKIMTVGERAEDVFYITGYGRVSNCGQTPVSASKNPWCARSIGATRSEADAMVYERPTSHEQPKTPEQLKAIIEQAYESRAQMTPQTTPPDLRAAIEAVIELLDRGTLRVAEKQRRRLAGARMAQEGRAAVVSHQGHDRDDGGRRSRLLRQGAAQIQRLGQRAIRRRGHARRAAGHGAARRLHRPNVVLMPSFVNIGAYVDSGTMVDTWATVGSCAQIGKNVHLSGGVGIGGVLEPLQASPTIIEDNCFIGARSEIVEGVIVETGAVISMGVFIGQSTRIYDRERDEILYGRVPAGAVVVPGSLPAGRTASTRCPVP